VKWMAGAARKYSRSSSNIVEQNSRSRRIGLLTLRKT
jgi:hypothetical protein